jgi:hypothetical protein
MPVTTEVRTKSGQLKKVALTPSTAIKHHCHECCGWDRKAERDCRDPHCALYPFSLNEAASKHSKFTEKDLERRRETAKRSWAKGSKAGQELPGNHQGKD